ncbi:MAG TPA: hypothetical protein VF771_00475 [Longimicrobiaceae bacterium]
MPPIARSILAVVAGFVFIAVLAIGTGLALMAAGVLPPQGTPVTDTGVLLLTVAYVAVYAIAGCWLTARLAPSHPMRHALIEGVLGLAFTLVNVSATWALFPRWYSVVSILTVMPYAWIGGRIRERQLEREGVRPALAS